jgi:hypothetical protein
MQFLERYEIKMAEENSGWQDAVLQKVCSRIYQAMGCGDIQAAFKAFDTDGDQYIEYEEFMATLKKLDVGLSDMQIYELMRSVDVDKDSKIDFKEFAGRFEVVFTRVADEASGKGSSMDRTGSNAGLDEWTLKSFSRIGQALLAQVHYSLLSYTRLIHSSHTLVSYTLVSYTPLRIHSSHTLLSHTLLSVYTRLIHSCLIHSSHTLFSYTGRRHGQCLQGIRHRR